MAVADEMVTEEEQSRNEVAKAVEATSAEGARAAQGAFTLEENAACSSHVAAGDRGGAESGGLAGEGRHALEQSGIGASVVGASADGASARPAASLAHASVAAPAARAAGTAPLSRGRLDGAQHTHAPDSPDATAADGAGALDGACASEGLGSVALDAAAHGIEADKAALADGSAAPRPAAEPAHTSESGAAPGAPPG
eukprot:1622875-Pleurochrysis_carterae.AAC.1